MSDKNFLCVQPAQPLTENTNGVPSISPGLRAQRATLGNTPPNPAADCEAARKRETRSAVKSPDGEQRGTMRASPRGDSKRFKGYTEKKIVYFFQRGALGGHTYVATEEGQEAGGRVFGSKLSRIKLN